MKLLIGCFYAFFIGGFCGLFEVPLPAPNHWMGVLLIVLIYLGYLTGKGMT